MPDPEAPHTTATPNSSNLLALDQQGWGEGEEGGGGIDGGMLGNVVVIGQSGSGNTNGGFSYGGSTYTGSGTGANAGGGYSGGTGTIGGGGSSGNGHGTVTEEKPTTTIVPTLTPCENSVLTSLLSLNGDDIAAIFDMLGNTSTITWTVSSGVLNPLPNGTIPNASTFTSLANPSNANTLLNSSFTGRATNIAVARTLIHESIHVYLEKWGIMNNTSQNATMEQLLEIYVSSIEFTQSEQHQLMGRIVSQMASTLQNYCIANGLLISHECAENLFLAGLPTSTYYQSLSANRKLQITLDNQAEEYNSRFELPTDSTVYSQKQGVKACP